MSECERGCSSFGYEDSCETFEDCVLTSLAEERLSSGAEDSAIPEEEVMVELGLSEEDIDAADDQEID